MDRLSRAFCHLKFKLRYAKSTGNEFQQLFEDIMTGAHGEDFQTVRPYGKDGDFKCDGYLTPTKTVFQVYAPREMKQGPLRVKIEADFVGALEHWAAQMETWIFVHNDCDGLPPEATRQLARLQSDNPDIKIGNWGEVALLSVVDAMPGMHLEDVFGPIPTITDINEVGFDALEEIIDDLARQVPVPNPDMHPPSVKKLALNGITGEREYLLHIGRLGEHRVEQYYAATRTPELDDEISKAFGDRYQELQDLGTFTTEQIFDDLYRWVGAETENRKRWAAALAVFSYYFERCIVFENEKEPDNSVAGPGKGR